MELFTTYFSCITKITRERYKNNIEYIIPSMLSVTEAERTEIIIGASMKDCGYKLKSDVYRSFQMLQADLANGGSVCKIVTSGRAPTKEELIELLTNKPLGIYNYRISSLEADELLSKLNAM